jgi:hypothetical protein
MSANDASMRGQKFQETRDKLFVTPRPLRLGAHVETKTRNGATNRLGAPFGWYQGRPTIAPSQSKEFASPNLLHTSDWPLDLDQASIEVAPPNSPARQTAAYGVGSTRRVSMLRDRGLRLRSAANARRA